MAQVNIGAIKFNWKGPYNNSTAYVVDDVVSSGGSSYVCILASTRQRSIKRNLLADHVLCWYRCRLIKHWKYSSRRSLL